MHISFINQLSDKYYITNQKSKYTQNPVLNNFSTNLNNLPNYSYLINFNGTTDKIINDMLQLKKTKRYSLGDLEKLFDQISDVAKEKIYIIIGKFEKEGLSFEDYRQACLKRPTLFYYAPETIEKNVFGVVKRFEKEGLTSEAYLKACLRQPALFSFSPGTIEKHILETVKKFEKEGLTSEAYLKACLKQPSLFTFSPETLERRILELIKKFESEGLTSEAYLNACLKQPQLFYQTPETIKKNILEAVKGLEKDGLSLESYLQACLKRPSLLCQSPETIERNVRGLVKKFEKEGLSSETYLQVCLRQPTLFALSPETVENHIKAFMYVEKNIRNRNEDITNIVLHKNLISSTATTYLIGIILPQMKKQSGEISKWTRSGIKQKLQEYFKCNPDKKFTIRILNDEMSTDFIKTIKEYCQKNFGRDDMFNIVVVK